jgi:hypothetical protein
MATWKRPKTPSQPPVCFTEVDKGCPFDCGLCPEHGQHSCSALLEITQRCNMHCPVCFADSGSTEISDPSLETLDAWYRSARHACGDHIVIQLSGGEPTVRDDLPDIIAMGRRHGFSFIQLNTNGLRLAENPAYARQLAQAGLANVFLQFDGTEDAIYLRLRGRTMMEQKRRAIDHAMAAGLGVVLVPTLVPGVNTDNIGAILDFGLQRAPGVRGVHFQPISYFGRFPAPPADVDRITLPEILQAIEQQSAGRMQVAHFAPPGCEHSLCSFHGIRSPTPRRTAAANPSWRRKAPGNRPPFSPASGRPRRNRTNPSRKHPRRRTASASTIFWIGSKPIPSPSRPWPFRMSGTSTWNGPATAAFMWLPRRDTWCPSACTT